MIDFHIIILGITTVYLLVSSLIIQTKDLLSTLIFKVIPFFLGLGCLFSIIKLIELIELIEL